MIDAVVSGVSAGGMTALGMLLPCLPARYKLPVIVVQHSHPRADDFLARYLNDKCSLRVKQTEEKEPVMQGVILIGASADGEV